MRNSKLGLRVTVKAIIILDGCVLLIKKVNDMGGICYGVPVGEEFYDLPGGGQERFEDQEEAIIRECAEELGMRVEVERLLTVHEEISDDAIFNELNPEYAHKVVFTYKCKHIADIVTPEAEGGDLGYIGCERIPWEEMSKRAVLRPDIFNTSFLKILASDNPVFLGTFVY